MKYLILGRTGTGKDTLASHLERHGLRVLKSYATRPKRYETEDTHIFIDPSDVEKYKDKIAYTKIGDIEYFATRKQLDECDIYIIDPRGLYEVTKNCPDLSFHVVLMKADKDTTKQKAIGRIERKNFASDEEFDAAKTLEGERFDKRYEAENEQFSDFEEKIEAHEHIADNACIVHQYTNDYDSDAIENFASYLYGMKQTFDNLMFITRRCFDLDILTQGEIDHVNVSVLDEDEQNPEKMHMKEISVPIEHFVDTLIGDQEGFVRVMQAYLASDRLFDDI